MEPRQQGVRTADGRSLSTYTWGDGTNLVVLEAGLGISGRSWAPVAHLVSDQVTAVAYDRSGYGVSTPDSAPRTVDRLARDLCDVIEAQAAHRVVLVGHSLGGPIVRRAAQLLPPGTVSSLVLVDPSDERAEAYFTRTARVMERAQALALPVLSRTGALGAGMRMSLRSFLADDDLTATVAASSTAAAARACVQENHHLRDGLHQLRSISSLASIPTTVISGTKPVRLGKARRQLLKAHRAAVASNPGWRLVEADESTHQVMFTQPELVAAEILRSSGIRDPECG